MKKKYYWIIWIIIIIIFIFGVIFVDSTRKVKVDGIRIDPQGAYFCTQNGGKVITQLCCKSVSHHPNTCLIGACGCSPENSHEIEICDCGEGKCWNGTSCVDIE